MNTLKSILLVEDDRDDQIFFIEALSEIANVTLFHIANNGREALEKLENSAILPDLIFTDINMPVMNGTEFLSAIIKNPYTRNIPVVVLTTSTGEMDFVRRVGAKAFIKKPSDCKILRDKLEQVIGLDFNVDNHVANQTFQLGYPGF
ncbi:MAG: response regulator [Verrucomicrobia bacterium]|nr:response regulator [Cytophagales bacterium]